LYTELKDKLESMGKSDKKRWQEICGKFPGLSEDSGLVESPTAREAMVKRISDVIDNAFIPYVRNETDLTDAVEAYLPGPGQRWEEFFESKLEKMNACKRRKFLRDHVGPSETLAWEKFKMVINKFKSASSEVDAESAGVSQPMDEKRKLKEQRKQRRWKEIDVYYATDRFRSVDGDYLGRAGRLRYGFKVVAIPDEHVKGKLETPYREDDFDENVHVWITEKGSDLDREGEFEEKIKAAQALAGKQTESDVFQRQALLYIHGYNVNHKTAIKLAAQLKYDLNFDGGLVILYSWPSMGSWEPWNYRQDTVVIQESAKRLHGLITTILSEEADFSRVHILAHSMGNRALIKALKMYAGVNPKVVSKPANVTRETGSQLLKSKETPEKVEEVAEPTEVTISGESEVGGTNGEQAAKVPSTYETGSTSGGQVEVGGKLANVIFAAADETRDKFEDMLRAMRRSADNGGYLPLFTIYSSVSDIALMASTAWNFETRLGDTRSLLRHTRCVFKRIYAMDTLVDVVDASGLSCDDMLFHSYYSKVGDVLTDVHTLLKGLERAEQRSPIIKLVPHTEWHFYAFDSAWWTTPQTLLLLHKRTECLSCLV